MTGFMHYLNRNSALPFMYKMRNLKGKFEYFLKLTEMYVHTRTEKVTVDDGEREGQLQNNFVVQFDCAVRFPTPKFYAYYSLEQHELIRGQNMDGTYTVYELCMTKVPQVNNKGWNRFVTFDFMQSEEEYNAKLPLEIDLKELFTSGSGKLKEVADYTKSLFLSPSVFIDIKLFNNFEEVPLSIDWGTYTLKSNEVLTNAMSFIAIYVDLKYVNEQQITANNYKGSRIKTK